MLADGILFPHLHKALNVARNGKMTLNIIIKKINWRQILVHFVGMTFLIFSLEQLSYLFNIDMFETLRKSTSIEDENIKELIQKKGWTFGEFVSKMFYLSFYWLLGLFFGLIISMSISIRKKWYWLNSFIAFLLAYFLIKQGILGWNFLKVIFLMPGKIFNNLTLYLATNATILIVTGLFIFYNKKINNFISKTK